MSGTDEKSPLIERERPSSTSSNSPAGKDNLNGELLSSTTSVAASQICYVDIENPPPPQLSLPDTSGNLRLCRFCLGEEGEDPELGKLMTPCLCRDTVHEECLQKWRLSSASAFYSCNVCKWKYKFSRVNGIKEAFIRVAVPLWPLTFIFLMSLLLGFVPVFGSANGNFGVHLLNGISVLGLVYLTLIVTVFNVQYCRLTMMAARAAASAAGVATLPLSVSVKLLSFVVIRCMLVGLFFGFFMVYFFPFSGFMGIISMLLASPPAIKEIGDRLIRRIELERPVSEVTLEMQAQAASEAAIAAQVASQTVATQATPGPRATDIETGSIVPAVHDVQMTTADEHFEAQRSLEQFAGVEPPLQQQQQHQVLRD